MGEVMKEAAFSLAEAKFATGDFNQVVLQNVTKAQIKIRTKKDNVAGVTLPVFESYTVSDRCHVNSLKTDCSIRGLHLMFISCIAGWQRHIRVGWLSSWWSAIVEAKEKLSSCRQVVGGIGFVANVICYFGRSHQDHKSKSQRYRAW